MPDILFRQMFSAKYVAQMPVTLSTDYFGASSVGVQIFFHRARNFLIK